MDRTKGRWGHRLNCSGHTSGHVCGSSKLLRGKELIFLKSVEKHNPNDLGSGKADFGLVFFRILR